MRIAHFIDDYSTSGGTERVASNLTKLFPEFGIEVPVVFTFLPTNSAPFFDYGVQTSIIILDKSNELLIETINHYCTKFSIDLIIFHGYHSLFFNTNLNNFENINCPIILRTAFSSQNFLKINPKYPILPNIKYNCKKLLHFYLFQKKEYKKKLAAIASSQKIVTVSKICESEILNLLSCQKSLRRNIFCVHNPILFSKPHAICKEKIVLYVGRLREKKKNSMLIVRAWETIARKCPDWKLLIIGDGELVNQIERYIEKQSVMNVELLSPQIDIQNFYQRSQIVVCTSNSDALPQVLVEGAFFSNALLTTAFDGGYTEIVENGINGFVVPKNNLLLFSQKLLFLITHDKLRESMMERSPNYAKYFYPECVMDEWLRVFNSFSKRNPTETKEE